jgi:hypothetical protein
MKVMEEPEKGECFFSHFFVVTLPSAIHFARLAAVAGQP